MQTKPHPALFPAFARFQRIRYIPLDGYSDIGTIGHIGATQVAMETAVKRKTKKRVSVCTLISKLERNIALANMRGDLKAAETFRKMLEAAWNSTNAREVLA